MSPYRTTGRLVASGNGTTERSIHSLPNSLDMKYLDIKPFTQIPSTINRLAECRAVQEARTRGKPDGSHMVSSLAKAHLPQPRSAPKFLKQKSLKNQHTPPVKRAILMKQESMTYECLEKAEQPAEPIRFTEWEAFVDDAEIAGTSVEALKETLGVEIGDEIPKAARAYLELLLKVKDPRHEVAQ